MGNLEQIIQAVIARDGSGGGESLIVPNHLAQLKLFGARGIQLFPAQDDSRQSRKKFIEEVWKYNRLDLYLDYIWDLNLCCGEILFYLRPTGQTYEITWYHGGTTDPNPEFKVFYQPGGRELESVIIAYPYKIRGEMGAEEERWVKLLITKDQIERRDLNMKPNLNAMSGEDTTGMVSNAEVVENTLGYIPCVVIPNQPSRPGQPGTSEFHHLRKQIERHDRLLKSINRNLSLFSNPTLVTTRSRGEVMESAGFTTAVPTIASQSGYYPSTNRSDARERLNWEGGEKVAAVVGGVNPDERFGYIQVDPVSGDQNLYEQQYREQLHSALGGVDPLGIRSGATAYEVKVRSGQTAATARKKCLALYDYGICKLFEMAILSEEKLFRESLFGFVAQDLKGFQKALSRLYKEQGQTIKPSQFRIESPEDLSDDICQILDAAGMIPPGVIGLLPQGDRTIQWRFTSEIFPDTSREILDKSIVGRNLAEAGINTEYVLQFLFPEKTEKEINKMQAGNFSYRVTQNKIAAIGQLVGIYQQFMSVPDPENPQLPLAARVNPGPLIEQALSLLAQEFDYGNRYDPADQLNSPLGNQISPEQSDINNGNNPASTPNPNEFAPNDGRGSVAASGLRPEFPIGSGGSDQSPAGYAANADFRNPLPAPGGTQRRNIPQPTGLRQSSPVAGLPADIAVSPELWSIFSQQQSS